jgi:hypothetical protein
VSKDLKRLWYSINFGGDQTINIVEEGFMQMEYISSYILKDVVDEMKLSIHPCCYPSRHPSRHPSMDGII